MKYISIIWLCGLGLCLTSCVSQEQKIERLITQLGHEDVTVRAAASETLVQIGEPAVPVLIVALTNEAPAVREKVIWKLSEIGKPTEQIVPALIGALSNDSENVRVAASMALTEVGTPAVPFLIQALESADADIRLHSVYALGEIGFPENLIIPALIGQLNDKEWNVRRVSVRALVDFGERAEPQLRAALNHTDAEIRRLAQVALSQMELRTR